MASDPIGGGGDRIARTLALSPDRRALLARLAAGHAEEDSSRSSREVPLSAAQTAVWLEHRRQPDRLDYNLAASFLISGPLSVPALSRSFDLLFQRHPILSARIGGEAPPAFIDGPVPALELVDGSVDPGTLDRAIERTVCRPFDLGSGPLARAALVAEGSDRHTLVLCVHHLVCDGWSVGLLLDELGRIYAADLAGRDAPLRATPLRDAGPAAAPRQDAAAWWRETLAGAPAGLSRRIAVSPPRETRAADSRRRPLPAPLWSTIQAYARQRRTTPFAAVVAAVLIELARRSGDEDLLVATPLSGRSGADAGMIGLLAHSSVLRVPVRGEDSFADIVERAGAALAAALAHSAVPADLLAAMLASVARLASVAIGYEPHRLALVLPGVRVERVQLSPPELPIDLSFVVREDEEGAALHADYRAALFTPELVESMLDGAIAILARGIGDPSLSASQLAGPALLLPLTATQLQMWMGQEIAGDAPAYNQFIAVELTGAVDVERFAACWRRVAGGCDMLTARFVEAGGLPRQAVGVAEPPELRFVDLAAEPVPAAALRRLTADVVSAPFALDKEVSRTMLVRVAPERHVWILCVHHLCVDGRSFATLAAAMLAAYEERQAPPPAPFAPIVRSLRDLPAAPCAAVTEQLFFGEPPPTRPMKVEIRRPALGTAERQGLAEMLRLARRRAFSAEMAAAAVAVALCASLLHRIGGARRIAIGFPIHNRTRAVEAVFGPVMEVRLVTVELPDRASPARLIDAAHRAMGAALRDPGSVVANAPDRRSYAAMVDVERRPALTFAGSPVGWTMGAAAAWEPLALLLEGSEDGWEIALQIAPDFFGEVRSNRVTEALLDLVRAGVEPDAPLPAAPPSSGLDGEEPRSAPFVDAIEAFLARAEESPARIAIDAETGRTTYAELAERARRIAGTIASAGVAQGSVVAVSLPRSADQAAAWLGVMFAGATCQPLDPALGRDATRAALSATGAVAMLAAGDAPAIPDIVRFTVEEAVRGPPARPRVTAVEQPALALLTSGTTGEPRVVLVSRGALGAYVGAAIDTYGILSSDRVVQFASPGFDTAAEELLTTLAAGATLLCHPAGPPPLPEAYLRWAARREATLLNLPTAYWHLISAGLDRADHQLWPQLRLVIIGGEAAGAEAWRRWRTAAPHVTIANSYGPTEATVVAAVHLSTSDIAHAAAPPIGRPLAGTSLHVLTDRLEPVFEGVPGELYIGGAQVALGYAGAPGQTAHRFIPDPFSSVPGSRLYRTGDRVSLDGDGNLVFRGRFDRQVKLAGRRLALDEVELALLALEDISQARADLVEEDGIAALHAWVVPAGPGPEPPGAARRRIAAALPESLPPLRLHLVDRLPLTLNQKVRAPALADGGPPEPAGGGLFRLVRDIVCELLGLDAGDVAPEDSFFAIGGDSLRAIQLLSRLNHRLGTACGVAALFERPTLAGIERSLADCLCEPGAMTADAVCRLDGREFDRLVDAHRSRESACADPETDAGIFPAMPAQEEMWLQQQTRPQGSAWNVTSALRTAEPLEAERLTAALHRLAERHQPLRTRFQFDGRRVEQEVLAAGSCPIPVEIAAPPPGEDEGEALNRVRRIAEAEARRPFDLGKAPLCRVTIVQGAAPTLIVAMHHIICDGWSAGLMWRELRMLYDGATLDDPHSRYAALAARYRDELESGALDEERLYWTKMLADLPDQRVPLPLSGEAIQDKGSTRRFRITPALAARCRERAVAAATTLYAVLVAALATTLRELGAGDDIAIGCPEAGRDGPDWEPLIGLFVNTLTIRVDLSGDPGADELLQRTAESCRGAIAHRRLAARDVRQALRRGPERPLFRTMLTLLSEPTRAALDGRDELLFERGAANRDLTMRIEPAGDALDGHVEYRSGFATAAVDAFIDHFLEALSRIAGDSGTGAGARADPARNEGRSEMRDLLRQIRGGERGPDREGDRFPIVYNASRSAPDAAGWIAERRALLLAHLEREGAVLLRGFAVPDAGAFEAASRALEPDLSRYEDQSTPRTAVDGAVYTATEYPADRSISLHNEMAYSARWPRHLMMFCQRPADEGGATPLADSRAVLRRLDPALVDRFRARGVTYIRNFGTALDLPWSRAFGTGDRAEAERYFAEQGMEWSWREADQLTVMQTRPATVRHPVTGAESWFNVAHVFHLAGQDAAVADAVRRSLPAHLHPRHARFGDGSEIEAADIAAIHAAYRLETIRFTWCAGDLLLIDNVSIAHGRDPYRGPRRVLVTMGGAPG